MDPSMAASRIVRQRKEGVEDAILYDKEGVFPVQKILQHRVRLTPTGQRHPELLVRWEGQGPEQDSWETLDRFMGLSVIEDYCAKWGLDPTNTRYWEVYREKPLTTRKKKRKKRK